MFALAQLAVVAAAQQVRVRAPVSVAVPVAGAQGGTSGVVDDPGRPVEMFENDNLDRYLRRAETFLERSDYAAAIHMLQDVAEGRTPVEIGTGAESQPDAGGQNGGNPSPDANQQANSAANSPSRSGAEVGRFHLGRLDLSRDERFAVFASDGRLFRPVRRLGQEMLARMPTLGIDLYRTMYDADAERMLEEALADGSVHALQAVVERYFVSLAAGRAMAMMADRSMHEGRYRTAVQVLNDLLAVYPEANRRRLGQDDTWLRFKIALCLAFAGEQQAAHAAATQLATAHHEDSLRILGELHAVKDLPAQPAFHAADDPGVGPDGGPTGREPALGSAAAGPQWLTTQTQALVPLWQYRFADPEPYREPKSTRNNNNSPFDDVVSSGAMPFAGCYYPGTNVQFAELGARGGVAAVTAPRVLFFEHFRLRAADALTGLILAEGDGPTEPSAPRDGHPRIRIAASDYSLLQALEDDRHVYGLFGYGGKSTASAQVFRTSMLVAYDRGTLQRVWDSQQWLDGELGLREATFLAAPVLDGERLFLPGLRRDIYTLECLDRQTGRPLWVTPLHSGGSEFFKAPGVRAVVDSGTVYVHTNAGCLAAVDAFTGNLRWIRRYERTDPLRPPSGSGLNSAEGNSRIFTQAPLTGFFPSDLVVANGLVCIAPVDGDVLMCLDGATGKPVWMLDASSRYLPFGRLRILIGVANGDLFACSDSYLVCMSLRGGLLRWARELPVRGDQKTTGRGRGAIVGDHIVVPNLRELLVFDLAGEAPMRRLDLPSFGAGREPLAGSFHVSSQGPWVAIGYPGGVELLSSAAALGSLAEQVADPMARATCLIQAGRRKQAEAVLREATATSELARSAQERLLASLRVRALAMAESNVEAGLAILDELALPAAATGSSARELRLDWHLARLDCCEAGGDLRRLEAEQQHLYDFMEGR